jgi:hypothetical protein
MKSGVNRIVVALLALAMTGVMAFAKGKKQSITFPVDVMVNGTLVKRGDYDIKFDEQTGDLFIMKGKTVVAKTTARLEKRADKAPRSAIRSVTKGSAEELVSISFRGQDNELVINQGGVKAITGN